MFNDELFQKIVSTPGMTALELAVHLGQTRASIHKKLNRLEKYDVIYTRQVPSSTSGRSTVKSYYPLQSALKYKR